MSVYALTKMNIDSTDYAVCFGLDEKRKLTSFHLSPLTQELLINDIYIARVEKILPNIHAAFVRVSDKQTVYLPLANAKHPVYSRKASKKEELTAGDELLVCITQEALKTKDPQGTCDISLQSNFFVLTLEKKGYHISHKIKGTARDEISQVLNWYEMEYLPEAKPSLEFGIVTRSIAEKVDAELLKEDLIRLTQRFMRLIDLDLHKALYSLLYREAPSFIGHLKNSLLKEGEDRIVSDDPQLYKILSENIPSYSSLLEFYNDDKVSLSTLYNLRGNIDQILARQIWLKSGANIIIEQLETLTFIDVNTAKSTDLKETALQTNLEALSEISKQLRFRNLSGMILIDFINMTEEDSAVFIDRLKKVLREDPVPCKFHDITRLGIVELTRKKTEKSVKQILEKRA